MPLPGTQRCNVCAVDPLPFPERHNMAGALLRILLETLQITTLVLLMMITVDLINVRTRGAIARVLVHARAWRQYVVSSLLGSAPGCVGAFTNVSLYMHGMISFGALAGSMVAVSGDEAFVMLAMIPRTALLLFAILFVLGIMSGWVVDYLIRRWKIRTCTDCETPLLHPDEHGFRHWVREHLWHHIIRRHLVKTALWTFGALVTVHAATEMLGLGSLTAAYPIAVLVAAVAVGLIPESGPHLIFVSMFAEGLVPFSVLLASSIVQDGHGLLPLLPFSLRDSMMIKGFNAVFGLSVGLILLAVGV